MRRRSSSGSGGATYGAALASREFRAVFAAATLSVTGNVVADIVQTVLIYDRTRSPALASLSFTLGFLPYLVTGTLLSGLVDRVQPRRLLVAGYLGAAAFTLVMALPGMPVSVLLALVTVAGFCNGLGAATQGALVRAVVSEAAYVPARSLIRIAVQTAQIAANPVGGLLIVAVSARGGFIVAACIIAAAGLIALAEVRVHPGLGSSASQSRASASPPAGGLLGDSLNGMREVFALPVLRRLLLLGWVIPMFSVAPESLAAAYVSHHGGSPALVGWWLTGLPVGIVAGDLLGVLLIPPAWQRRLVGVAGVVSFLPYLAFAVSPSPYMCIPLLVASGMCSMYSLGLDARVREAAPRHLFARTMAVNSAGLLTIQALGFPLAGLVAGWTSPGLAVGIAGACGIAGTLLLWPRPERSRREAAEATAGAVGTAEAPAAG